MNIQITIERGSPPYVCVEVYTTGVKSKLFTAKLSVKNTEQLIENLQSAVNVLTEPFSAKIVKTDYWENHVK